MSWHNKYIKIPFIELGRTWTGADCWGITKIIYKEELNIDLPDLLDYQDTNDKIALPRIIGEESKRWMPVTLGQEKPFDVAVFKMRGVAMHVGIVVREGYMIHCQRGSDTTFERYIDLKWKNRIEGFYRYAENSDCPSSISA